VLASAVLLSVALGGAAGVASAATYPPAATTISVSTTSPVAGQDVTVTGSGFKSLTPATLTTSGPGAMGSGRTLVYAASAFPMSVKSLTTDAVGSVSTAVHFTAAGTHTVTISGIAPDGTPASVSTTLDVLAAAAAGSAPLAHTGAPMLQYVLLGAALLALGGLLVATVRSRRRRSSSTAPSTDKALADATR
jgi:hypothetical protein